MNKKSLRQNSMRTIAEAQLVQDLPANPSAPLSADQLEHELRVHQIELEMQNEELRRTHIGLTISHDRYVDLYDFAPVGYLTLAVSGLIEEVNLTGAVLLGVERSTLYHDRFARFVTSADSPIWYRFLAAVRQGKTQNCELVLQRADATLFHARLDGRYMGAGNDSPAMVRITLTDISERKQVEDALRISESRFRGAFETAAHGMALLSSQGKFLKVNHALCIIVGYEEAELLAMDFQTITHPEDHDVGLACMRQLLAGSVPNCKIEKRYLHRDGHVIWVSLGISLVTDGEGRPLHFVAQTQDITARKSAEVQLLDAKKQLEIQVDCINRIQSLFIDESQPDVVFNALLVEILRLTSSAYGFIAEVRRNEQGAHYLQAMAISNIAWNEETQAYYKAHAPSNFCFTRMHGLHVEAFTSASPVIANDPANDPRRCGLPPGHPPLHAFLGLPIKRGQEVVGVLGLANRPQGYDMALVTYLEPVVSACQQIMDGYLNRNKRIDAEKLLMEANTLLSQESDALRKNQFLLSETEKIGKIGGWKFNADTGKQTWTEEIFKILEVDLTFDPTVEKGIRFYTPASRPIVTEAVQRAVDHGEPFDLELELITAKGNLRNVHVIGKTDLENRKVYGFLQDITEHKKIEDALRKERDFIREMVNALPGTLYLISREGQFQLWNKKFEEITGRTPEEVSVASPADFFQGEERVTICERVQEVFTQGFAVVEASLVSRDGTLHPHYFVGQRIELDGTPYLIGMGLDISERKRMEDDLRAAKKQAEAATIAKGEFLATMSHEIRTPMNAVMGLTDLALQTELTPKGRDYLTNVALASRALLRIINDILDFSKMDAGKLQLEAVDFLLRDVFDHQADLFRQKAAEKGIELILQIGTGYRYALTGDYLRLEQILINLVGNAIKFTEEGEIEVGVRLVEQKGNHVLLEFFVRDTGIGLSQEQMDTLFAPFVQVDSSTTRKHGGTGLGLSICKRLVEMMAGQIWVESTPGIGSIFRFTVLLLRREVAEQDDMTLPADMHALRVLVVDDNPTASHSLRVFLDAFGFSTTATGSGREALAEIQQGILGKDPYQLILVDWLMPEWDGIETIRQILEATASDETQGDPLPRIILLTTYDREEEIRQRANAMGIRALLPKPVNCSLLFDTIMELFCREVTKVYQPGCEAIDLTEVTEKVAGAQVLLVEDNVINQWVAREMLEKVGLVVTVAGDGLEAVRMVMAASFDLVLMDIQMPTMDGYTACRQIRKDPRFGPLPIIAMTAHAMDEDRQRCLEAGMVGHLAKPIDRRHLYATLMAWIKPGDRPKVTTVPVSNSIPDTKGLELPTILPGIDVADGLDRLGNNHQIYRLILLEFRKDFDKTAEKVRLALQGKRRDDMQSAQHLVHTIKGMSGNLSARRLFHASAALGQAIRENRQDDWPILLERFEIALNQVVDTIDTLQSEETETPNVEITPLNIEEVAPRLLALADAIQKRRADAVECCQTLRPLLKGTIVEELLQQVETSLGCYVFQKAQDHLFSLFNALDMPLPRRKKP
ncbi:MAG: PAS domain S-box protein [Magnetococcales bacterium]|nr:PAS domain S-box protein [Magnetococcales bacterium]